MSVGWTYLQGLLKTITKRSDERTGEGVHHDHGEDEQHSRVLLTKPVHKYSIKLNVLKYSNILHTDPSFIF